MRMVGSGYQLGTLIGRGSTGEVWAAETDDGRPVAVKILNSDLTADLDAVSRFVREGQILTSLRSPGLVRVHDLIAGEDTLGIVMDLVDGPDLHGYAHDYGPIPPALAAELVGQVLGALGVVHRAGIVHRDIKPENILIDLSQPQAPTALLSDFGIAMLTGDPAGSATGGAGGAGVAGTLPYIAPELIEHGRASYASDLYAVGVVLYELLAGRTPFANGDPVAIMRGHVEERPAALVGLPPATQALLDGLLAKNPAARPPSAAAARQLLTQAADELAGTPFLPSFAQVKEPYRGPTIPPTGSIPLQQRADDASQRAALAPPGAAVPAPVPAFVPGLPKPGSSRPWAAAFTAGADRNAAMFSAQAFEDADTAKLFPIKDAPTPGPDAGWFTDTGAAGTDHLVPDGSQGWPGQSGHSVAASGPGATSTTVLGRAGASTGFGSPDGFDLGPGHPSGPQPDLGLTGRYDPVTNAEMAPFAGGLFDPGGYAQAGSAPPPPYSDELDQRPLREKNERNRWWFLPIGLGLAAVAAIVAIVLVLTSGGSAAPPSSTDATTGAQATPTAGANVPLSSAPPTTSAPAVTSTGTPAVTPAAPTPSPSVTAGGPKQKTITMPRLTGRSLSAANAALSAAGLRQASSSTTCQGSAPKDQVLSQTPKAGTKVKAAQAISVSVQGDCAEVPAVSGDTVTAAQTALRAAGFTRIQLFGAQGTDTSTATVTRSYPAEGTSTLTSTTIYVFVESPVTGGGGGGR